MRIVVDSKNSFAQETFDATAGVAFGALGGVATATGAVVGGTKAAAGGTVDGLKTVVNAGADATYVVGKEAAEGTTQMLRRALLRLEDE